MRKKRCIFCASLNTKRYGTRSKKRKTSFSKRHLSYQRLHCHDCKRTFKPKQDYSINFSVQIKAWQLYYDSEASYRAVSRQYQRYRVVPAFSCRLKYPGYRSLGIGPKRRRSKCRLVSNCDQDADQISF